MNQELSHVQAGFRKGRRTRDQTATICWIIEKAREIQKNIYFSFSNSPSREYSGLISFKIDWLDLLAVQGTLKSLLQHHNSVYMQSTPWKMDASQAGIKIAGRNTNNLRFAEETTLMAESEEELKNLLMRVKEESEKVGLKLNIKKK